MSVSWYVNGSTPSTGSWKRYLIDTTEIKMFEQDDCNHSIIYVKDDTPQTFSSGVTDAAHTADFIAGVNYCAEDLIGYDLAYQVFKKGISGQTLNLYDENSNVVGYFKAGFYDANDNFLPNAPMVQEYVTAYSRSANGVWEEGSAIDYPQEREDHTLDYFCFRYLTLATTDTTATKFKINIHRNDVQSYADIEFVYEPDDMPRWNYTFVNFYRSGTDPNFFNRTALKYTLLTFYKGNTDIIYAISTNSWNTQVPRPLNYVETNWGSYGHNSTGSVITYNKYRLDAEGLAFIEVIPQEDEYVNELNNRFSPRFHSNMTAIYVVPPYGSQSPEVSGIMDVAQGLVETSITDAAAQFFAAGNECVIGIRWYYGLKDLIDDKKGDKLSDITTGGTKVTHMWGAYTVFEHAYPMESEFILWETSELQVDPKFDNYLDMVSNYKLYLPYYGFMDIDPNDIVGGTIKVQYNINVVTGQAMITVVCKNARTSNAATKYYSVACQVGEEIPFGADMRKSEALQFAEIVGKAGAFAIRAGTSLVQDQAAMAVSQGQKLLSSMPDSDDYYDKVANVKKDMSQAQSVYNATGSMQKVTGSLQMPNISVPTRSNGCAGDVGTLDELHPYLLITRPIYAGPSNYADYVGLPSYASAQLSSVSGFTQIAAVKPEALTNAPKYVNEIISLLQAGVYL